MGLAQPLLGAPPLLLSLPHQLDLLLCLRVRNNCSPCRPSCGCLLRQSKSRLHCLPPVVPFAIACRRRNAGCSTGKPFGPTTGLQIESWMFQLLLLANEEICRSPKVLQGPTGIIMRRTSAAAPLILHRNFSRSGTKRNDTKCKGP